MIYGFAVSCHSMTSPNQQSPNVSPSALGLNGHSRSQSASQDSLADLSCISCRKLKRKCSKGVPTCSLCARVGRVCEYPTPPTRAERASVNGKRTWDQANGFDASPEKDYSSGLARAAEAGRFSRARPLHVAGGPSPVAAEQHDGPRFNRAWYVDSVAARAMNVSATTDLQWNDIEGFDVSISLDDAKQIAADYFQRTHEWFPVVSYMRITRYLKADSPLTAADTVALFVAMHLISQGHERAYQAETQGIMYRSLKAVLIACEQHGQFTTNYIAAMMLTGMYEIAQVIYPAAYFTVGAAARACFTIGLHDKYATQLADWGDTWTAKEERRRLYWGMLVLDRYINLGFGLRPLAMPVIPQAEILPADDDAWDQGEAAVNLLLVMSIETRAKVSPFARSCQAAHLVGRISQHTTEHPNPCDPDYHFQEAQQIQRAATALLSCIQKEYDETLPERRHKLFSALALCCGGLLALYDVHACIDTANYDSGGRNKGMRMDLQEMALSGFRHVAGVVLEMAQGMKQSITTVGVDCVSPLALQAIYAAAATYAWYARENGSETYLSALNQLREVLTSLSGRWRLAGKYNLFSRLRLG